MNTTIIETQAKAPKEMTLNQQDLDTVIPQTGLARVIKGVTINGDHALGFFPVEEDDRRIIDHFRTVPGVMFAEFSHLAAAAWMCWISDARARVIPALLSSNVKLMSERSVFVGDSLTCRVEKYTNIWVRLLLFIHLYQRRFPSRATMWRQAKRIIFPDPNSRYVFFRSRVRNKNGEEVARVKFTGIRMPLKMLLRQQRHAKQQQ